MSEDLQQASAEAEGLSVAEMLDALGDAYTDQYGDWLLEVNHILTEPTCPTAVIHPEDDEAAKELGLYFRSDADTIEDAVANVVALAYATLVKRQPFVSGVPWSNPGENDGAAKFWAAHDEFKARAALALATPNTQAEREG